MKETELFENLKTGKITKDDIQKLVDGNVLTTDLMGKFLEKITSNQIAESPVSKPKQNSTVESKPLESPVSIDKPDKPDKPIETEKTNKEVKPEIIKKEVIEVIEDPEPTVAPNVATVTKIEGFAI